MSLPTPDTLESTFNQLCDLLIEQLQPEEHLSLELDSERSQFIRFNNAKVRQTGLVADGMVKLTLMHRQRTAFASFPFTGEMTLDQQTALDHLHTLREDLPQLPEDPYLVLPQNRGSSREIYTGKLLSLENAAEALLSPAKGVDMTGLYTAGTVIRANANSAGQRHWFATDSFIVDYSLIAPNEKAVKGIWAGQQWDQMAYQAQMDTSRTQLSALNITPKILKPGRYRTYFAPAATADLVNMLSWGAVSEASLRQGGSALGKMREGKTLSPLLTLRENFGGGTVPKFNELGEIAAEILPIIAEGKLVNTLVNARTAKEYQIPSNAASRSESLRSPELMTGTLSADAILSELGTGLYLSNLHYLNWSDHTGGRITGMTRYACFWVENGELIAPIENLRFDESLYAFWGENLAALTDFSEMIPDTGTYGKRELGGCLAPGMIVDDFQFTL